MVGIRAHFDGSVAVPDEPVAIRSQTPVVILAEGVAAQLSAELERQTREYYESGDDDDDWGRGVEGDLPRSWDEE